jgi:hypothetical protein
MQLTCIKIKLNFENGNCEILIVTRCMYLLIFLNSHLQYWRLSKIFADALKFCNAVINDNCVKYSIIMPANEKEKAQEYLPALFEGTI